MAMSCHETDTIVLCFLFQCSPTFRIANSARTTMGKTVFFSCCIILLTKNIQRNYHIQNYLGSKEFIWLFYRLFYRFVRCNWFVKTVISNSYREFCVFQSFMMCIEEYRSTCHILVLPF